MVTINLLPIKSELRRRSLIQHGLIGGVTLLVLLGSIISIQLSMQAKRDDLNQQIADSKVELARLTKEAQQIEEFKKQKEDLERKLNIISDLNVQKSGPVEILDQLSLLVPEKAWLTSINNSGTALQIEGVAVDNPTIAHFMKSLQSSQYFKEVELVLSQQDGGNQKFVIKCKISLPA